MATIRRIIPAVIADDGSVHYTSVGSPPDDSIAICHMVPDRIIPVIFVPGVMGTNLQVDDERDPNHGKAIWLVNGSLGVASDWAGKGAATRKQKLDPTKTTVYAGGNILVGQTYTLDRKLHTEAELRRRGWGEVAYLSYGESLVWLENALNDGHADTEYGRKGLRASLMQELVAKAQGVEPLTREEWSLGCKYQFPVHAVGYNWLQSNADSAETLAKKIDEFIAYYRETFRYRCEQVIIVTHSMGGLVARHYSEVLNGGQRDKILGIVHGVMPSTGAAIVYKRIKAGTAGMAGIALGPDAATMTAVFAQSPGPLQLLPSVEYGMNWLRIKDGNSVVSLPETDPYKEIYAQRGQWWGLCDDKLINPLDKGKQTVEWDWKNYTDIIFKKVKVFHKKIANKYHPHTYAFYGDDASHKTWGDVVWERRLPIMARSLGLGGKIDDMSTGKVVTDNGTGEQTLLQRSNGVEISPTYIMREARDNGDGTVPIRSGGAPGHRVKACVSYANVEHESAFRSSSGDGAKPTPQQMFTLWAITRIAQNVKGTTLEYKE
ncbi:triacylglycerol lipase [Glaciimonas sp. PAMC28666]|uniref:esterase/lipase family protein n=1 Tax=Glaciimonas sp. PAMC28666 TaxID=2807626 RepID=UPI0019653C7D|nr:hypothetical protein [Glaciimonas sp. PAMC28666]QRX83833.1 hypothetical protein JQN73_06335 [Glaciimonas sp. PAMC28666]